MSHRKPIESEPPLSPVVFHILLALATGERHGYDNHAPSRARYPSDHEARSRSSRRPRWLLPALLALAFFALDPLNLALLPVGLIDDLVLLPLLLRVLARLAAAPADDRVIAVQ